MSSINITVPIPSTVVAAVKQGSDLSKTTDAIASITKAVIESVKALPDDSESTTAVDEDNLSIKSFDSNEPALSQPANPRPKRPLRKKRKIAERTTSPEPSYQIFFKDLTGKTPTLEVTSDLKVADLKEMVEEKTGVPPASQRLIFAAKQLENDKTLAQV